MHWLLNIYGSNPVNTGDSQRVTIFHYELKCLLLTNEFYCENYFQTFIFYTHGILLRSKLHHSFWVSQSPNRSVSQYYKRTQKRKQPTKFTKIFIVIIRDFHFSQYNSTILRYWAGRSWQIIAREKSGPDTGKYQRNLHY